MNRIFGMIKKILCRIPKDFTTVFSFDFLAKAIYAMTSILLIRVMSVTDYAVFVKFTTIASLIMGIFGSGISLAFVRYAAEERSRGSNMMNQLYFATIIMIMVLGGIAFCGTGYIGEHYGVEIRTAALAVSYGVILSLDSINRSYFQAKEEYARSGALDNLKYVMLFIGIISIYLSIKQIGIISIEIIYVVCTLIAFAYGLYIIKKSGQGLKSNKFGKTALGRMIKESLWLMLYCTILSMFNQSSIIMLTKYAGSVDVAQYGVALKYYSLLSLFLGTMQTVIRIRTSKKEIVDSAISRSDFSVMWIKRVWPFAALISVGALLLSKPIFPFINGPNYNEAIPAFQILAVGVFVSFLFASNVSVMMSAKRYMSLCIICTVSLFCNVLINYLLIPNWGINATALGTMVANGLLNVTCFIVIQFDSRCERRKKWEKM